MGFAFFQPSLLLSNALKPTFFIERRMLIRWCLPCSFFLFLFFLFLPIECMGLIEDKVVETGKRHYNDPIKTFDF